MFQKIDEHCFATKSPQVKRQTKYWMVSSPPSRVAPGTMEAKGFQKMTGVYD